jgi:hypothetical protein
MSSISEQMIKDSINAETSKMITASKLHEEQIDNRILKNRLCLDHPHIIHRQSNLHKTLWS